MRTVPALRQTVRLAGGLFVAKSKAKRKLGKASAKKLVPTGDQFFAGVGLIKRGEQMRAGKSMTEGEKKGSIPLKNYSPEGNNFSAATSEKKGLFWVLTNNCFIIII